VRTIGTKRARITVFAAIFFVKIVRALANGYAEKTTNPRAYIRMRPCRARSSSPVGHPRSRTASPAAKASAAESCRCGKHAGGYQQGIARKEKSDKESGFNENNYANKQRSARAD